MSRIETFERMLEQGQDTALLRFSLGTEYLAAGDADTAIAHLRAAVEHDPAYSAAWQSLGKAGEQAGDAALAMDAYRRGIDAAEQRGDKQAAKQMRVFLRRVERGQS